MSRRCRGWENVRMMRWIGREDGRTRRVSERGARRVELNLNATWLHPCVALYASKIMQLRQHSLASSLS